MKDINPKLDRLPELIHMFNGYIESRELVQEILDDPEATELDLQFAADMESAFEFTEKAFLDFFNTGSLDLINKSIENYMSIDHKYDLLDTIDNSN